MNNKNLIILFSLFILLVLSSCTTTVNLLDEKDDLTLEENEGFVVLRILNPKAGQTIDSFFTGDGQKIENQEPLYLNSDLVIKKAPGSFTELTVKNTTPDIQLVIFKLKKGSYGIIKVGENSEYLDPYIFKIDANVINYVGDIKLDIVNGKILIWRDVKDYYDLSVEDNFTEIQALKNKSELLNPLWIYPLINHAKATDKMTPLFCHIIRE